MGSRVVVDRQAASENPHRINLKRLEGYCIRHKSFMMRQAIYNYRDGGSKGLMVAYGVGTVFKMPNPSMHHQFLTPPSAGRQVTKWDLDHKLDCVVELASLLVLGLGIKTLTAEDRRAP